MDNRIATDSPAYLKALGLASPPFVGARETMPWFNAASRRKTLDMILYLGRYSDLALLVHGPTGCGKYALLREMTARAGLNIHAVTITGQPTVDAQSLYTTLLGSFKLLTALPVAEQQLLKIKEQLDHLQRKGYHCILSVDNADRLAPDAYAALEQLIDMRSEAGRNLLNVVMFAQQPDKIALRGPSVRHRVKRMEVPALMADEVGPYLQHCMHHVGGDAIFTLLFNERTIAKIARDAEGWPGAINALAQQRLIKFAARKHPKSAPVEMRVFSKKQFAAIAVATAILLAVFAFQDDINNALKPAATVATISDTPPTITAAVVAAPATEIAPLAADNLLVSSAPTQPETAQKTPELNPAPVSETTEPAPVAVIIEAEPPPLTVEEPIALPIREITQPTPATKIAAAPARTSPPLRDEWLLTQNPVVFTLQITGSTDERDVRRTLKKYGFTTDTAIYTTQKKGKPWYGLVTGIYSDQASAQQALAALPAELMRGTWVRRMRAVQGEINKSVEPDPPTDITGNSATSPAKPSETN